jgi:hypothetical protein
VNTAARLRHALTTYVMVFGIGIAAGYGVAKAWVEFLGG